ncbi:ATP-dependent proteinase [Alkalibaculum bacchi]|uniref:Lon protease n=1 Tax=Alkalibaculum bacchi TaxID=645887 RepID=A0A366IG04_9FIRM|nr:ATP-dependent proteinase [Alkalibaculum bacchi]
MDDTIKYIEEPNEIFQDKEYPLIPLRGLSVFPGMVLHFDVGRTKSINALEEAMADDQNVILVCQRNADVDDPEPEDLYSVGTLAVVKQLLKMPGNVIRVLVEIEGRALITEYTEQENFFKVHIQEIKGEQLKDKESKALLRMTKQSFITYLGLTKKSSPDIILAMDSIKNTDQLLDVIGANLLLDIEESQDLLQELDTKRRVYKIYEVLVKELELLEIEKDIDDKVKDQMDKQQKEYYLREQMRVIQEELGDGSTSNSIEEYREKLSKLDLEDEIKEKVEKEISRLSKVPSGTSEAGVIQTYIEWILDLPWNTETEEFIELKEARKILDEDHYALDKVKERILEYLAVTKLSNSLKAPILCLVGPPGVGKTSIAKSISRAIGRKFVRMSLGGMRDEAEIRGHRRTYVGAIPGRIIYNIKQAESKNPLFLLDEIDKMSQDFRGDPASALLEVLDPEQNTTFTDNYLELPFDLSKVMFITTANSTSTIPGPLLDRMEIIELSGYMAQEKLEIAKKYLLPKQTEMNGLKKSNIKISEETLMEVINYYSRESGVRGLERLIARICRVVARIIVEDNKKSVTVNNKNLEKFLGSRKYFYDIIEDKKEIGLVNGLAWTSVGGETLQIEAISMPGKGKVELTGHLGDVMKESALAGISYIRSKTKDLGIDENFYKELDIHLHVPEGAIPKDGPSAGITMTTALISMLTKTPVNQNLAMTGEITLRGRVLPIGGVKEKLLAAHRANIRNIIIPKENEKDLDEIPDNIKKELHISTVGNMEEVIQLVFHGDL